MDFGRVLRHLVERPHEFTPDKAHQAIQLIPTATPVQIASYLTALKLSSLDSNPLILSSTAQALLLQASVPPQVTNTTLLDIVGTGGDGQSTFNVSTAAALIVSGSGCKVAKVLSLLCTYLITLQNVLNAYARTNEQHGNRSSSSPCGSADVLEALGCSLSQSAMDLETISSHLHSHSFVFLFAQHFHPAMKLLAPIRKELGFRTIFNVLGPLLNPLKPQRIVVGVHSAALGEIMAKAFIFLGVERAWIVHGKVGLDEISPQGETLVWDTAEYDANKDNIPHKIISPKDFGLEEHSLEDVRGGGQKENAEIMVKLLSGKLPDKHPILDFCLLNAGALLYVAGMAQSLPEAVTLARKGLSSGAALKSLQDFAAMTSNTTPKDN